jgi:general secretion pathway protein K
MFRTDSWEAQPFPWLGRGVVSSNSDERGFALILTILVVSVITALTIQFSGAMRSDLFAAATLRDEVKLRCTAKSGVNYALAVLSQDATQSAADSLQEDWTDSISLSSNCSSLLQEGRSRIQILDHSGRIAINMLVTEEGEYDDKQKDLLTRFLNSEEFGLDSEEIDNMVDAIKDWIDADSEETRFGAEDSYYQALSQPYRCRNAPLVFLEELLLVRGVTEELYYGTKERPGISAFLTTHGEGKININTAHPLVLRSLSDQLDDDMVENMADYRNDTDNDLSDPSWYQNVTGIGDVRIDADLITTSSSIFEIVSEGVLDDLRRQVNCFVERDENGIQFLSWKMD